MDSSTLTVPGKKTIFTANLVQNHLATKKPIAQ